MVAEVPDETHGTEDEQYIVVVNHEEQYSIWPNWRDLPLGWTQVGDPNEREACLDWIEEHWTDMRPKSLRLFMDAQASAVRQPHDG